MVKLYSEPEVRKVVPSYLRGVALKWISNKLSSNIKALLRLFNLELWMKRLIKRFKMKSTTTISRLK